MLIKNQSTTATHEQMKALALHIVDNQRQHSAEPPRLTLEQLGALNFYVAEIKLLHEALSTNTDELWRDDLDPTGLSFMFFGELHYQVVLKSPGGVMVTYTSGLTAGEMTGLTVKEEGGVGWSGDEDLERFDVRCAVLVDENGEPLDLQASTTLEDLGQWIDGLLDFNAIEKMLAPQTTTTFLQRYLRTDALDIEGQAS